MSIVAAALVVVSLLASLLAVLLWRSTKRAADERVERARQQELLEQQAAELEEQAAELEIQVQALGQTNAELVEAEAAGARAHWEALEAMKERLRQTARFEAAMRAVPIAMAIIDQDLRYVKVNAACADMTGCDVDGHAGRTLREVNPILSPELEAAMRRVLETGEPCTNYRLSRPTPHARTGTLEVVMHITAIRDVDGSIMGIASTATDVTEWEALQQQFYQAQKLEAVGTLAAGIAHDFNNLLTVISSYCDLVLMELAHGSPHRNEIGEIRSAATRASTLARRMLGIARSRALVIAPVELREAVLEARDLLSHAIRRNVTLEMEFANEPGVVGVDPTQLEQMLLNLVINAADAMPNGGTVTIRTRDLSLERGEMTVTGEIPAGDYVELSMSDTGVGMDGETLSRIFEPFFTTKAQGKGTGLGLATVFGIVRDLHGGLVVESVPGKGTTFRLLFPRLLAEEATGPRTARSAVALLPRGHETLLLVEDEDALRASMARVFSRHGYRVLEASHGGEALRVLASERSVDLVVSDLSMPGVGGRELYERIHALGHHMPVLFVSGSGDDDAAAAGVRTLDAARDRFLAKPFEVSTLLTTVREMLEPA